MVIDPGRAAGRLAEPEDDVASDNRLFAMSLRPGLDEAAKLVSGTLLDADEAGPVGDVDGGVVLAEGGDGLIVEVLPREVAALCQQGEESGVERVGYLLLPLHLRGERGRGIRERGRKGEKRRWWEGGREGEGWRGEGREGGQERRERGREIMSGHIKCLGYTWPQTQVAITTDL